MEALAKTAFPWMERSLGVFLITLDVVGSGRMVTPWIAHPMQFAGLTDVAGGSRVMYCTLNFCESMMASLPAKRKVT